MRIGPFDPAAAADVSAPDGAAVIRHLIDVGLLTTGIAVENGVTVTERSVSHRAYDVHVGGSARFFVKQSDPARSQGRDLRVETAFYRFAETTPELSGIVPRCWLISDDDTLIVLDAVHGSVFVPGAPEEGGAGSSLRSPRANAILKRYGSAMARIHGIVPPDFGEPPWLLLVFEQADTGYGWLPGPCRDLLLRLAALPQFVVGFRAARAAWQPTSLVHGDSRWTNLIVSEGRPQTHVWLVDWELACRGDPAWDIGCVLADLVVASQTAGPQAGVPESLHHSALAFLDAYRREAQLTPALWLDLLRRSVRLSGVRLVQTLVEYGHNGVLELRALEPSLVPWAAELIADAPILLPLLTGNRPARGPA